MKKLKCSTLNKLLAGLMMLVIISFNDTSYAEGVISQEQYEKAEMMVAEKLITLVKNSSISPNWIENGEVFWYRRDTQEGQEYILVEAENGSKNEAFDHHKMAQELSKIISKPVDPNNLIIENIEIFENQKVITAKANDGLYLCVDNIPSCKLHRQKKQETAASISPDGKTKAIGRGGNIWLKDVKSEELEQLTHDGNLTAGYAIYQEAMLPFNAIESANLDNDYTPNNLFWSPNNQTIFTQHIDETNVEKYPFLENVPMDGSFRPKVYNVRMALLGDKTVPVINHYLIDVNSGSKIKLNFPEEMILGDFVVGSTPLGWGDHSNTLYLLATLPGGGRLSVLKVDVKSGKIQIIYNEYIKNAALGTASDLTQKTNFRILENSNILIVQSERSGSMHLYAHDVTSGAEIKKVSNNIGRVFDILKIDDINQIIFVTGSSSNPKDDPYYRYLYKVSLKDGTQTKLTSNLADHNFSSRSGALISPNGKYFIDTYSDVKTPPVTVLRSTTDGTQITELEIADATELFNIGWRAPIRFKAKAADKTTDLYGIINMPLNDLNKEKYPIIDAQYINPIVATVPKNFTEAVMKSWADLTSLGIAVVTIDGRGTPRRDKNFGDFVIGNYADIQIEDHIAVIKQLSEIYKQVDIGRVGIFGHSNGGDAASRAILKYGHFFKVAFASAGSHSYHDLPGSAMQLFGFPKYADGTGTRPLPDSIPVNYKIYDNAQYASGLNGKLMIAYSDLDRAALPSVNLRLASALIDANKSFDLLYIPNTGHSFLYLPYYRKRLWEYFAENL